MLTPWFNNRSAASQTNASCVQPRAARPYYTRLGFLQYPDVPTCAVSRHRCVPLAEPGSCHGRSRNPSCIGSTASGVFDGHALDFGGASHPYSRLTVGEAGGPDVTWTSTAFAVNRRRRRRWWHQLREKSRTRSLRGRRNVILPGQVFDGQAGLHQNGFRDYDPAVGRYVESDPFGLGGGVNTYVYVAGAPLYPWIRGVYCNGATSPLTGWTW
jgi:RHS repeat-associated protein